MDESIIAALQETGVIVVTPGHTTEWDNRIVRWNKSSPAEVAAQLIDVPFSTDDVVKIVNCARQHGETKMSIRAGGRSYFSTASVVIAMRDGFGYATGNQETGLATVGMGQTLGELDERTHLSMHRLVEVRIKVYQHKAALCSLRA